MRRKWRRRVISTVVVAVSVTLAFAATGADPGGAFITASPRILGIRHTVGMQATGATTLLNGSNTSFTVGSIEYTCDSAMQLLNGSGGSSFTIGPGSGRPVVVECPSSLGAGMHRCNFAVKDSGGFDVLTFIGFCETATTVQLSFTPSSLDFPLTPIGGTSAPLSVMIGNTSSTPVPLSLQVDSDDFVIGTPCQNLLGCDNVGPVPPFGTFSVNVHCKPTSSGMKTGNLHLIGDNGFALPGSPGSVPLTCMAGSGGGGPVLVLNPPNVLLGNIEVNGGTDTATIALVNQGTVGSLTIDSVQISGVVSGAGADWTYTVDGQCPSEVGCVLGPGQTENVRLTFNPSDFNSREATLIVNYTDPIGAQQQQADLNGFGVGATLELASSTPGPLDFGVVPVGVNSMFQSFTIKNQGNRQTTATLSANPMAPFQFPTLVTVDPGQTDVMVNCFSTTEIAATRTLTIGGADAPVTPDTIDLICDVRNTSIVANPPSIPLGEVRIGPSFTRDVEITSTSGPVSLMPVALVPTDPNLSLAPLTSMMTTATTTLTIAPTVEEPALTSKIRITPTTGSAIDVPVTGSIVRPEHAITDVMTLGTFCIGQTTSPTSVTYTSTGTATLTIQDVELVAGASSPFTLVKQTPSVYPASLAPNGGIATVLVQPKRVDNDGTITADLDVADDLQWTDDFDSPKTHLTAKYVTDGGAIAPGTLDFGDVPIRIAVDNGKQVTLQNCSAGQLELAEPTVPAPFELGDQFPTLLDPADRATFTIAFHPTEVGSVEEELVVMSTDGMEFRVTLRGNGIAEGGGPGGDTGNLDETSFYACGCRTHDPRGVFVIALAVCGLLARRRRR